MKENLLSLFLNKLHSKLKSENLGFKVTKYATSQEYSITELEKAEIKDFDTQFLQDNLSDYFFSLRRNNKELLSIIFHELITECPQHVFTQLSTFPVFHTFRKSIDDSFPSLDCIFERDDLILYLKNYKDKDLICNNYYGFERLLNEINRRFQSHKEYEEIVLHNFKVHSTLIKKAKGNIIATRSWCIKNLNIIDDFEEFITLKDDKPLFYHVEDSILLKFLDVSIVQSKYVINNAKGTEDYKNLFKSLISVLNSPLLKKELQLSRVEGQFVFDNKNYQITFFSPNKLNSDIIEEDICVLLTAICEYYNKEQKQANDFDGFIFKVFQYHSLKKRLVPLGRKSEKVPKI